MSFIVIHSSVSDYFEQSYIQPSNVDYAANIYSGFAICKLIQTYHINIKDIHEATYQFPIDYNSSFCELVIRTPREELVGFVKEKTEAKNIYNEEKRNGRQAFLTEESSSDRDIYKLSMCNVKQNDVIDVEYTYITELEYDQGINTFYIPSFISPRYKGNCVPDPKHSISIKIIINNDPSKLQCSMPNTIISVQNNGLMIEHKSKEILENDIEIKFNTEYEPKAYKFESGGYTMAMMQFIPQLNITNNNITKEVIFVLDCSGSMGGDRIDNSKKAIIHCLEKMIDLPNYIFNILCYGSNWKTYSHHMLANSEEIINRAIEYCQNISADLGGTETENALTACLDMCKTAILITDGDTSANQRLHNLCKKFNCLSILGIGSGINRANIKDMAKNGSGIARFSQDSFDIIQNMDTIFKSITRNSIKKYKIDWANDGNSISSTKPVIFGELNTLYSIIYQNSETNRFTMENTGIDVQFGQFDLPIDTKYIGALAAKRIIQENEIDQYFTKEKLIELAVKFNVITPYTSMVAISKKNNKNIIAQHVSDEKKKDFGDNPEKTQSMSDTIKEISRETSKSDDLGSSVSMDYLYDYYINDDKFNDQLRQNLIQERNNNKQNIIGASSTLFYDMLSNPYDVVCDVNSPITDIRNKFACSLKNGSHDIRGDIPNPKISITPWMESPIKPDPIINQCVSPDTKQSKVSRTPLSCPPNTKVSRTPLSCSQDIIKSTIKEITENIPYQTTVTPIGQQKVHMDNIARTTTKETIYAKRDFDIHAIPYRPTIIDDSLSPKLHVPQVYNINLPGPYNHVEINKFYENVLPWSNTYGDQTKNKIKHKPKTDVNCDYLFDYFMNEDMLDHKLKTDVNCDYLFDYFMNEDMLDHNIGMNDFDRIFDHMKINLIPNNVYDHFNQDMGLFNPSIGQLIPNIPWCVQRDTHILTIFILYCLSRLQMHEIYNKCYPRAITNNCVSNLIGKIGFKLKINN
jgi:uncharacterized protein YegL